MLLPPLCKYLDVDGAKLTLGNRTFRHGKPVTFQDLEEMTVRSVFPEDVETALSSLSDGCVDKQPSQKVDADRSREPPISFDRISARRSCENTRDS